MRYWSWLLMACALLILVSTLYGVYQYYSPIPFWDEWDSYELFYKEMQKGGMGLFDSFFSQHNEHRIFFSKCLFYIGFRFWKGNLAFQIICVLVIQSITVLGFWSLVYKQLKGRYEKLIAYSLVCAFCFSWIHRENFNWGFQTQFVGVFMLAFFSYILLYQYSLHLRAKTLILSLLCAFLSVFSMANGLIEIPCFVLCAWSLTIPRKQKILILLVNLLYLILWFSFPVGLTHHPISISTLLQHIDVVLAYFLLLCSGAFSHLLSAARNDLSLPYFFDTLAYLIGLIPLVGYGYMLKCWYQKKVANTYQLVFVFFMTFLLSSAVMVSIGRYELGLEQSFSSRYKLYSIFIWLCLILFFWTEITQTIYKKYLIYISGLGILLFTFLQILSPHGPFISQKQNQFLKQKAFLAFRLGIRIPLFRENLYPEYRDTLDYQLHIQNHIIPFDILASTTPWEKEEGVINHLDTLASSQYYTLLGSLKPKAGEPLPTIVSFADARTRKIVGYGVVSQDIKNGLASVEGFVKDTFLFAQTP